MPTELPHSTRFTPKSEFALIALASLLPWSVSLLLAYHDPAIAHAFLLLGQLG